MKYVILDLEWDTVYYPPQKRFVNQILQIGAVKLDENFNKLDTLELNIKSQISKKVSKRFTDITGITTEDMLSGIPLYEAVEKYNTFVKDTQVAMTWSDTDLYTILDNQKVLLKEKVTFSFDKYLDLQKLVQGEMQRKGYESKNQVSLESAAQFFKIDTKKFEFHTALDDSLVCGELLKATFNKDRFNELLKDTKNPEFFARLRFKARPISNIKDEAIDKKHLEFRCPECNAQAKNVSKWKYHNRWFSANFKCAECGFKFNGRVSFKRTYDEVLVKRRICEYRVKKNDMQSMPKEVQLTSNRN